MFLLSKCTAFRHIYFVHRGAGDDYFYGAFVAGQSSTLAYFGYRCSATALGKTAHFFTLSQGHFFPKVNRRGKVVKISSIS
ncbi:TPA: hypothetical protein DDW35_04495 [Candidatus Sumerlaeota bacterium]|nr:hypothetical protein [Candidatus Sumerlaeota bacterium]